MTFKVKECEDNIKKLSLLNVNNNSDSVVISNMRTNLAEKIRNFTHEFRKNEEKYMNNYKELVGDTDSERLDSESNANSNGDFLQIGNVDYRLKKRDEEISTLVTSISELAQTFKDLQMLVQEQGTILDRIDYNIDSALDNTKDAHKQLQKANENMKKNCFRNATMSLLVVIFIEAVLILLKFTS